ncbi:hypothetical protein ACHWQZ_G010349 [Mnemiopsis leidyi]
MAEGAKISQSLHQKRVKLPEDSPPRMNPRKKFKPRNSNSGSNSGSNSENELPSVLQGHCISNDRQFSSESKPAPAERGNNKQKRSPRKNSPPVCQKQIEDFASPKLSFSSPNAAEVPLPPTHWFSGCSREVLSESTISNQLKVLLNVM